jgi:hypothetical protein
MHLTTRQLAAKLRIKPKSALMRALRRGVAPAKTIGRNHLWTTKQMEKLK